MTFCIIHCIVDLHRRSASMQVGHMTCDIQRYTTKHLCLPVLNKWLKDQLQIKPNLLVGPPYHFLCRFIINDQDAMNKG